MAVGGFIMGVCGCGVLICCLFRLCLFFDVVVGCVGLLESTVVLVCGSSGLPSCQALVLGVDVRWCVGVWSLVL